MNVCGLNVYYVYYIGCTKLSAGTEFINIMGKNKTRVFMQKIWLNILYTYLCILKFKDNMQKIQKPLYCALILVVSWLKN